MLGHKTSLSTFKKIKINTEIQRIIRDYYQQLYANKMAWTMWKKWTNS